MLNATFVCLFYNKESNLWVGYETMRGHDFQKQFNSRGISSGQCHLSWRTLKLLPRACTWRTVQDVRRELTLYHAQGFTALSSIPQHDFGVGAYVPEVRLCNCQDGCSTARGGAEACFLLGLSTQGAA